MLQFGLVRRGEQYIKNPLRDLRTGVDKSPAVYLKFYSSEDPNGPKEHILVSEGDYTTFMAQYNQIKEYKKSEKEIDEKLLQNPKYKEEQNLQTQKLNLMTNIRKIEEAFWPKLLGKKKSQNEKIDSYELAAEYNKPEPDSEIT